jgi:hypothetical protein
VKRQILFCLLIVSGNALLRADDGPTAAPVSRYYAGQQNLVAQAVPIPEVSADFPVTATAGTGAPVAEPVTAPPTVVDPNAAAGQLPPPVTSQYQQAPIGQPGCATCGGGAPGVPYGAPPYGAPYGMPMGAPMGAPPYPGAVPPGYGQPIFPYSAQTPDVTMAPTTVQGPLPDRGGWVSRYEMGVMPFSAVKDGGDRFGEWAVDLGWKWVAPLSPSPVRFSFEQQYDLRLLTGPSSPVGSYPYNLPGSLQRVGWDFELKTAVPGAWNAVVAFTPSIDSDFQKSLTKQAFNWDGRAALLYEPSREITVILGAVFWDRLHERILPWAGVIYRPNQYWQYDLTFPQARVSFFMWDEWGFKTSLYARVEYHSEAYQMWNPVADTRDRVEMDDWRFMIGVNKDRGEFDYFIEGGWIFGRHNNYDVSPIGFTVDTGALIRAGLRF